MAGPQARINVKKYGILPWQIHILLGPWARRIDTLETQKN